MKKKKGVTKKKLSKKHSSKQKRIRHKKSHNLKKTRSTKVKYKFRNKKPSKVKRIFKRIKRIFVKPKKVSSGISNFDKLTEGGFEQESINLVVGDVGVGKSILSTQFLIEGIKKNEPGLYITFEESKKDFYDNMLKIGIDLAKLEKEGKFFFLEYTPEKVRAMLEEGGGIIESIVLRKKIKRIVFDSITSFELLFDNDLTKREASLSLFSLLRRWSCTAILTYESDSDEKKVTSRILEFESDSIIVLHSARKGKERKRFLEVLKMRGVNHSKKMHLYEIGKGGIILKG
jgi:circadian clock protein KaiC